jgi:putative transcriptional regulator
LRTTMKELREVAGVTQAGLAKVVDVSRQTILFMEKGKYNPSLRLAWRISQVLGSPLEEVFSFEDEEWRPPEVI